MFKKLIRFCFIAGMACILLAGVGFIVSKIYFTQQAVEKANTIIKAAVNSHSKASDDEVIAIARSVFQRFKTMEPSKVPALRLRPYLSNSRLPEFLRFPEGVIETNVEVGMCDNAARMLHFLLKQKGYQSVQWNMVTGGRGHSALLVYMPDGRRAFLDPFYGFAGYDKEHEKLLSPEDVRERIENGSVFDDVFLSLGSDSNSSFYNNFQFVSMAEQGKDLHISVDLPLAINAPVFLGEVNNDNLDVKSAAGANKMTPFWHYMGHKYDRSWVRVLKVHQNIRLEMTLLSDVEEGVVTAEPRPEINGNKMIWNLSPGDEVTFTDGKAKISWQRLNSFIGVDQIAIYPN